jgi:hypothetical protein
VEIVKDAILCYICKEDRAIQLVYTRMKIMEMAKREKWTLFKTQCFLKFRTKLLKIRFREDDKELAQWPCAYLYNKYAKRPIQNITQNKLCFPEFP